MSGKPDAGRQHTASVSVLPIRRHAGAGIEEQLLGAPQLAFDITVFRTGTGLQRQSAVGPELALGAEAMRGLDERH